MSKTIFNDLYSKLEKHGDRLFIVSMLTLVMIVAFAFKKPANNKLAEARSSSNVEYSSPVLNVIE